VKQRQSDTGGGGIGDNFGFLFLLANQHPAESVPNPDSMRAAETSDIALNFAVCSLPPTKLCIIAFRDLPAYDLPGFPSRNSDRFP
jgi:hypothetical protein